MFVNNVVIVGHINNKVVLKSNWNCEIKSQNFGNLLVNYICWTKDGLHCYVCYWGRWLWNNRTLFKCYYLENSIFYSCYDIMKWTNYVTDSKVVYWIHVWVDSIDDGPSGDKWCWKSICERIGQIKLTRCTSADLIPNCDHQGIIISNVVRIHRITTPVNQTLKK